MKKTIIYIGAYLLVFLVEAQQDSTSTGEVVDAEILIEKSKEISFPTSSKLIMDLPSRNFELDPIDLSFRTIQPDFTWPSYQKQIEKMVPDYELRANTYNSYILAGYGNFSSPLVEAGTNYDVTENLRLNASAFYESYQTGPIEEENSGSSEGEFKVSGVYAGNQFSIRPALQYQAQGFNFYGNTDRLNSGFSSEATEESSFRDLRFDVLFQGSGTNISYSLQPVVYRTNHLIRNGADINEASGFEFTGGFSLKLDSSFNAGLDLAAYQSAYQAGLAYDRSLFKLSPWVSHTGTNLNVKAGFSVTSGEVADFNQESGFYPFVHVDWGLTPTWRIFGFFESDIQWNNLNALLEENLFLDDSLILLNTRLTSSFGGGVKGAPLDRLNVQMGARLNNMEDMPFYVPSASDSSRFNLVYDSRTVNVFIFDAKASVAIGSGSFITANLELYSYTTKDLERPWHLPTYQFTLLSSHKIKEKVLISTELITQGGIRAPARNSAGFTSLDAFADLNIHTTYLVSNKVSVFVKANNLFGNEYEKYIGYPVRSLTFKLGGKYRF